MDDPYDLERFVIAQAPVFDRVTAELRDGRKVSHWMWFVFPQLAGLGMSAMSQCFAIGSLVEARAYLAHPVLGARLRDCVTLAASHRELSAHAIFGSPDDLKLRSSLTLFTEAAPEEPLFAAALKRFFHGPDEATLRLLG